MEKCFQALLIEERQKQNYFCVEDTNVKEDFFNIKTRLAGMALQKFINYHVKVAVIIEDEEVYNYRFKEMIMEANKGNNFRTFKNIAEAESWILKL
ncbi:MAG: DUF4180 domain-containing protein [Clostridium neonatale]